MNKLVKKIVIGLIVTLIIVAGIFTGYTLSKYTNTITGNGETEIAKWIFKVNGETEKFATIKLADTYDQTTLIDGKIAPGSSGSFDLVIDATGAEVGIDYKVDFQNEINKPTNLKFKYNEQTLEKIEDFEQFFKGTIDANDENKIRTLTVQWEWPYETGTEAQIDANDKIDTLEGVQALDYTFDIIVTGTQVIPSK